MQLLRGVAGRAPQRGCAKDRGPSHLHWDGKAAAAAQGETSPSKTGIREEGTGHLAQKGRGSATYYVPTESLLQKPVDPQGETPAVSGELSTNPLAYLASSVGLSTNPRAYLVTSMAYLATLRSHGSTKRSASSSWIRYRARQLFLRQGFEGLLLKPMMYLRRMSRQTPPSSKLNKCLS